MNQEEFKIQSLLKQEADFLIDCVESLNPWLKEIFSGKHPKNDFGQQQIRQLIQSATQASGLKELCLFIRYQMGRDDQRKNWSKVVRNRTLGEAVIEQLYNIEAKAKSLVSADDPPVFQQQLFLQMAERFFHYWAWQYRFLQSQAQEQMRRAGR